MNEQASNTVNITLHVLILFTFLTIFFFTFLRKVEEANIDSVTTNLVEKQTINTLNFIKDKGKYLPKTITNQELNNVADEMEKESKDPIVYITKTNTNLLYLSIILIIVIFVLLICMIVYFVFYKKYDIGFKHILVENLIIFSIAGVVEILFFKYVAVKYIPVTPDAATSNVLDGVKDKFNRILIPDPLQS